jgi:hypothetical protein
MSNARMYQCQVAGPGKRLVGVRNARCLPTTVQAFAWLSVAAACGMNAIRFGHARRRCHVAAVAARLRTILAYLREVCFGSRAGITLQVGRWILSGQMQRGE